MRFEDFNNGLETKIGTFTYLIVNGQTLMLRRDKKPDDFMFGMYVAPGGKFEPNETPEQCARREFTEETNLTLQNIKYLGRVLFDNKKRNFRGKPAKFNFLVYVFTSDSYSGDLKEKDAGSLHWITNGVLKNLPMEKGDSHLMELLEKGMPLNHRIALSDDSAEIEEFD